ncbi:MAG: lipopolysaccharide biosynthesis protein [Clostridia bacterium]|nr:lipopolysaccharide biosynthesis protein [Clostridia bacterium]
MSESKQNNKIMGGLFWKFGERLLSQGISFIISLVLARLLMPEDYGTVSIMLIFINLSYVFISSGFGTAFIQKKDSDDTDFSTMFYCSFICSIIIYFIIFFTAPYIATFYKQPAITTLLRVFALQIPISSYNAIQNAYISRNMLFKKLFLSSVISTSLSGALGIGMAFAGFGIWALVAQYIGATLVNTLVLAITVPWRLRLKFSFKAAKSLMKYGSGILLADLSGTFFGELRSLIIGRVYTSADLAFYSKGQQLPSLLTSNLGTSLTSVLFPAMSDYSDDIQRVKQLAKRSIQVLSYVIFPALFGLAALMEPLIIVLYTDKWAPCIPYAQFLSVGLAIGVLGIVPLQTIKAIGRSDVIVKLEFIKKPVYILLLVVGVKINVLAIAATMMIYDIYGTFVNMLQMKKYLDYGIAQQIKDILPCLVLTLTMAIAVLIIPTIVNPFITLIIKLCVGVAVYVGGSIIFKFDSFNYLLNTIKNYLGK